MSKVADRNQRQLLELLDVPGNSVCADCRKRNPRWSSANFGIFLCVECAGLHRKVGVHITKVKSLTLDTWTREQVDHMRANGNALSNSKLNPDARKNPPPTSLDESERNSQMERYIRDKYEYKLFVPTTNSAQHSPSNSSKINSNSDLRPSASPLPSQSLLPSSNSTLPSISKGAYDTVSIASSSDSIKHVRFRAASVPIPEPILSRPNSRLDGIKEVKPAGILRARSNTVAIPPPSNLNPFPSSQAYGQVGSGYGVPQGVIQAPVVKAVEPRFNPSIWDDINALAGNTPPPQQQQHSSYQSYPASTATSFVPTSQFGQQFQPPPATSSSPFQHTIQQQTQFQQQQQPFTPTTNPFYSSMNMGNLSSALPSLLPQNQFYQTPVAPQTSTNPFYPQQLPQPQYMINSQYQTTSLLPQVVDNSNPFTFNQPNLPQQQSYQYNGQQQQQQQQGGWTN